MKLEDSPRNILMVKGHAEAAGELLRSSAAWRALRRKFPQAKLHLWLLTTNAGGPVEELIGSHHLIYSFQSSRGGEGRFWGWSRWLADARHIRDRVRPDLVIDFEPDGLTTSILCRYIARLSRCRAVGVAERPWRGWFYDLKAPAAADFAHKHRLPLPMKETDQSFIALSALGIDREPLPIELRETRPGRQIRERVKEEMGANPILGVNLGSGRVGDHLGRPNDAIMSALVRQIQEQHGYSVMLTGTPDDDAVNRAFVERTRFSGRVVNMAGKCSIRELAGAISACSVFVTGYADAYHMSVGLGIPTLALFHYPEPTQYHDHPWVKCVAGANPGMVPELVQSVVKLKELGRQNVPNESESLPPVSVARA